MELHLCHAEAPSQAADSCNFFFFWLIKHSKKEKDIVTLCDDDVKVSEKVFQELKPRKMVLILHSTEIAPSVSMGLTLKTKIL